MYYIEDDFYVRTPLLNYDIFNECNNILEYTKNNFMESLAINSISLYNSINNEYEEQKNQRQSIISLIKYIKRASIRTTPFGINSFVSLGKFIDETSCEKTYSFQYNSLKKNLLLDYEWITKFLIEVEKK
ncbi:lantibiotic dehydratase [Candidatus Stoquefichus massiliensis]|uniref:lantibiotic dehydratase n=1 Tax=Candidatus Stoquefichus massiliensis TaxID=1470350 RepID=UPI00047F55E5|nr:lantibiotic dehydratase [Candidatus Stoquefichus massiliensis]